MYAVTHYAYCGMTVPLGNGYTYKEARERFKRRIEWFKQTYRGDVIFYSVTKVELCEPEDVCMVPDACGVLRIQKEEEVVIQ